MSAALDAARRVARPVELAPGYRIPPLVTGCWQLAADHGAASVPLAALYDNWRRGLEAGYTAFDCADIYTGVEELLGRFAAGLGDPDRVQIHTKYVPDRGDLATLDRAAVESAVNRSLRRLGREALDLLQFHWWDYDVPGAIDVAMWLDELRRAGKIRHLGLTNFDLEHVREIASAGVELTSVQVQYSVLDRRPAGEFASWCQQRGIGLLCYGTLAGGFLSERFRGAREPVERPVNRSLVKYRLIIDECGGWVALQDVLEALAATASRRGVTLPLAALRWALDQPGTVAAIVGASRHSRWDEYAELWRADWEEESWPELEAVLAARRGPRGDIYALERDPEGGHMAILRMNLNAG
jgi:aryl-alcohol dehydrogenase-like predicted oxidoreductase